MVDIDANELKRMKLDQVRIKLACDAQKFISALLEACKGQEWSMQKAQWQEWNKSAHQLRNKYPVVTDAHKNKKEFVSAYYFIKVLCDALTKEDIIVPESSGAAGEITYQAFQLKKGQRMKNAAGLGSMGFGLPYAIGSCLANNKNVLFNKWRWRVSDEYSRITDIGSPESAGQDIYLEQWRIC